VREGWKRIKLGSVLAIQNGYAFDSKAFGSSGMPLLRIRDLKSGTSTETNYGGEFDARYVVNAGDLLVGMDGEFACYEWKGEPALLNQRVCRLQGFDGALNPRFLFYGINKHLKAIEDVTGFTTVKHLSSKQILDIEFLVPSKDEQRRIVAILDEAFEGIATAKAHAERNLRNVLEVFAQSREDTLERSDGWLEAPLSELCEIRHGYAFEGEHFATHGQHVLLTPGSFFETGGFRDRGGKTKYFVGSIPPAFVLDEGDLLVAMTEQAAGLLGSPLLVPEDGRYLHNQRLGRVIGRDSVSWTNDFFFHVFNLRRVRAEIHASASGVKVRHTSPAKIGAVRVKFPPTSGEQSAVAAALRELAEDCHRLQALHTRKLAALDELKQSLLHQAFSGQL
jgi:type I restriction enzyme S subunit